MAWGLLAVLLLLPTLLFPPGRDPAIFAYVAETILAGGMPYRDAWDLKPPGIYLLYTLPVLAAAGGPEALGFWIRACDLVAAAATAGLLCVVAGRLGLSRSAPAAACWYAALYLAGGFWSLGQAEAWGNLPVLAAAVLLIPGSGSLPGRRAALAAGALATAAAACKYTAPFPLLGILCVQVGCGALPLRALAWFGAGGLAVGALVAAWLGSGGALQEFVAIQREFVFPYSRMHPGGLAGWAERLLLETLRWGMGALLPLLLVAAGRIARPEVDRPGARHADRLLGWALIAGLAAAWLQDKYFAYHWQTALPWLALLVARGGTGLLDRVAARSTKPAPWVPAASAAVAVVWLALAQGQSLWAATARAAGAMPREVYLACFADRRDFSAAEVERAAEAVRTQTRPEETILVWGWDAGIYLRSARRAPTRFFFNQPLVSPFAPARWRGEFLAAFDAAPPALICVARRDETPWAKGRADDSLAQLRAWPELSARLNRDYQPSRAVDDYLMFVRKERR